MLETGGINRGPFIDTANRRYAYLAAPYCASAGSVILDRLRPAYPTIRSAASRRFVLGASIPAMDVVRGKTPMPIPCIAVYVRQGGGHFEFVLDRQGDNLICFGFNTTPPGKTGSQWNGVWSGTKTISLRRWTTPSNAYRITHFTPIH